jgi:hypothetical protein
VRVVQVAGETVTVVKKLILPETKEQRWFSCASLIEDNGLAVADRCGNLHFYRSAIFPAFFILNIKFVLHFFIRFFHGKAITKDIFYVTDMLKRMGILTRT